MSTNSVENTESLVNISWLTTFQRRLTVFFELAKPERTLVNVITALSGFLLASKWHVDFGLMLAAIAGIALVIGSACVLNNFFDREIDSKMSRTKKRALPTDAVSLQSAIIYAAVIGILGFIVLAVFVNWLVVGLGTIAYIDYVILYGLAKRRTKYGALIGTVAGAMSVLAGYCAVTGRIDSTAVVLFLIMAFWQMPHFYSIAIFRLKDYKKAGIPVWPSVAGVPSTIRQSLFYTVAFVIASALLFFVTSEGYAYLISMLAVGLYWLRLGVQGFKTVDKIAWARKMFSFSLLVSLVLSVIIPVGILLP